jgi:hypothetical protein
MPEVQSEKSHEDKKDKEQKFAVHVAYNGVTKKIDIDPEQSVTALLQAAIQVFGVTQNPHLLSLYREDGSIVPEDRTITAAGIRKNEVLLLRPNSVKGGACI